MEVDTVLFVDFVLHGRVEFLVAYDSINPKYVSCFAVNFAEKHRLSLQPGLLGHRQND